VNKWSWKGALALVVVAVASALLAWQWAARELRACRIDEGLAPVAALLQDNEKILAALAASGYAGNEAAILERYLADIRQDGVPKHAATRRSIDALVDNNTVIAAVLAQRAAGLRTPELKVQADGFHEYANNLRDRWHALFETFMAGGHLPPAGPQRPVGLAAAVAGDIAAP